MKIKKSIIGLSVLASCLSALERDQVSWGIDVGVFCPFDQDVRDIYNEVLPDLGLHADVAWNDQFQGWLGLEYIWDDGGRSLGYHNRTALHWLPMSVGVKYRLPDLGERLDGYAAMGASYSFLWLNNDSPYVQAHQFERGLGAVAKVGFIYHGRGGFDLDGTLGYRYQRFHGSSSSNDPYVERHSVDLSGLAISFGLTWSL